MLLCLSNSLYVLKQILHSSYIICVLKEFVENFMKRKYS